MKTGLSSYDIKYLSQHCLKKIPHILPCDIFETQAILSDNSAFICNLETSDYSGSHYVCILILEEYIVYFDSIGLPVINEHILRKLKTSNKDVYYSQKSIQGPLSVFCGMYDIAFLIKCQDEKMKLRDFLEMFKSHEYKLNEQICTKIVLDGVKNFLSLP